MIPTKKMIVGRVYADIDSEDQIVGTTYLMYLGHARMDEEISQRFVVIGGCSSYGGIGSLAHFPSREGWLVPSKTQLAKAFVKDV